MLLIIFTLKCLPLLSLTWATPILDDDSNADLIVVGEGGNILEISQSNEDMNNQIQAQSYNQALNKWSEPINLSVTGTDAHHPKIATDPDGNAVAMWQITDGTNEQIQAAFYNVLTGTWTPPQNLTTFEKDLFVTHLAMSEGGHAFAAWNQKNNKSKIATFSRKLNAWDTVESPNLNIENPRNCQFYFDISNQTIVITKIKK